MAPLIEVRFEREYPVFKPGEKVQGRILLSNEEELKVRSIEARYRGKSHNGWYEYAHRAYYDKQEFYMNNEKLIWPSGAKSNDGEVIPPGKHEYDFDFVLPENSPSSFEGEAGWVRYTVIVTVNIVKSKDCCTRAAFTVVADMDLNKDEKALMNPRAQITKNVGFFTSKKPVTVSVYTDKGGYVPGETMKITIDINNETDKKIEKFKAFISQKAIFEGKALGSYHTKRCNEIAKIKENLQMPEKKQQQLTASLLVPSVPPSDLPNCSIIVIEYKLKVHVTCGDKVCVKLPVRIGTIPLQTTEFGMAGASAFPPPSYQASMFGPVEINEKEDDEESFVGSNEYTPLYPYLRFE